MLKKALLLAVAAASLAALAIPATASAVWTDNHQAIQQNQTIVITGQAKFTGQIGWVECQVHAHADLLANQTTATVTGFGADTTAGKQPTEVCAISPSLQSLGCTGVENVTTDITSQNHWSAHALSKQTIEVTTGTIKNDIAGGIFCPDEIDLTPGIVHIQTTETDTWHQGHLSGQLQAMPQGLGNQPVTITGTGTITPAFTYGAL